MSITNNDSLTVKAYLADEVRRVSVDTSACSSIDYMRQRLHHAFKVPLEEPLVMAWKDDEGDLITISSNEELLDAVNQRSDGLIRLYLSRRSAQSDARSPPCFLAAPPAAMRWARWARTGSCHREVGPCRRWGRRAWRQRRWQQMYEQRHKSDDGCGGQGESQDQRLLADMEELMAGVLRPFGVDVTLISMASDEQKGDETRSQHNEADQPMSDACPESTDDDVSPPCRSPHATQMDGDIGRALDAIKLK